MAKKEKPIEKQRKSYKRRGIFYCAMIIIFLIATILLSIEGVEKQVYKAVYPKYLTLTVQDKPVKVYSEVTKVDGVDVSAYYYLDEAGKKQELPAGAFKDSNGKTRNFHTAFKANADAYLSIVKKAVHFFLILFVVLLLLYLIRFAYYLSNKDSELSKRISDKLLTFRVKLDKRFSKADEKVKKLAEKKKK